MPASETDLKITCAPDNIYIEKSAAGQILNCDFILENPTDKKWRIKHIEVSVLDAAGKLVTRKFLDESGGIQTIPNRDIPAKASVLIFNPFFLFDHQVVLNALHYTFMLVSLTSQDTEDPRGRAKILETIVRPEYYATRTKLNLPVQERVLIWDGHEFYSHHRRFNYFHPMLQHFGFKTNFQRYGYDFVPVNDDGEMFRENYEDNADWFGFGKPVMAVADGRVADFFDGMPDNRKFNEMDIATREMVVFGNYVIINHNNGEYSCFAHLKQGSIDLRQGQPVHQGQVIGSIGASGSSLFPHLHYELRNGPGAKEVEGLPSYFHQFRQILGASSMEVPFGQIDTGDIVEKIDRLSGQESV